MPLRRGSGKGGRVSRRKAGGFKPAALGERSGASAAPEPPARRPISWTSLLQCRVLQESRRICVRCVGGTAGAPRPRPAPGDPSPGPRFLQCRVSQESDPFCPIRWGTERWLCFRPLESKQKMTRESAIFPCHFLFAFPRMLSGIRVGGLGRLAGNRGE